MRYCLLFSTFILLAASCGRNDFSAYLGSVDAPAYSVTAGSYEAPLSVAISAPSGTSIRYTTDPAALVSTLSTWTLYSAPLVVDRTTKVRSYAYRDQASLSDVASVDYRILAGAPAFSPAAGVYTGSVSLTLTSATAGAVIRYTLDGTDPTESNGTAIANGAVVTIASSSVLKARAYYTPRDPSALVSGSYFIEAAAGAFTVGITVTLPGNVSYVFTGGSASLTHGTDMTVTATHSLSSPVYQWYLNGAAISGATSSSVTLGNSGPLGTLDYGAYILALEILSRSYSYTEDMEFNVVP